MSSSENLNEIITEDILKTAKIITIGLNLGVLVFALICFIPEWKKGRYRKH